MPSVATMKLPAARAGQIKNLAASLGLGATELVERFINQAIASGELPDALPGFEVIREGALVTLTLDGQPIPAMHVDMAQAVADDLEHAGTGIQTGKGRPRWYGKGGTAECDYMLLIGRNGTGIVVVLEECVPNAPIGTGKRTVAAMTRGMAVDLARQIRAAANA